MQHAVFATARTTLTRLQLSARFLQNRSGVPRDAVNIGDIQGGMREKHDARLTELTRYRQTWMIMLGECSLPIDLRTGSRESGNPRFFELCENSVATPVRPKILRPNENVELVEGVVGLTPDRLMYLAGYSSAAVQASFKKTRVSVRLWTVVNWQRTRSSPARLSAILATTTRDRQSLILHQKLRRLTLLRRP